MRDSFEDVYMAMADAMSRRSRCVKGVGAIIVSTDNRPAGAGYNGPPAGWPNEQQSCRKFCRRTQQDWTKDPGYSDCPSNHAEINALLYSDFSLRKGGTIYITTAPCLTCAKAIANSGLAKAVWRDTPEKPHRDPRQSQEFLEICGIETRILP